MTDYEVVWTIDIDADGYTEAARRALEIQRDPASTATSFSVRRYGSEMVVDVEVGDRTVTTKEQIEVTSMGDPEPRYVDGESLAKTFDDDEEKTSPRIALLDDARAAVSRVEYGGPEDSFRRIADLWNQWVKARGIGLEPGQWKFTPADVAVMLMQLKMARLMSAIDHRDSIVDIAGYAACLAEIVECDS